MNYEEIIERLLDEKHITAKEAVYLLKQCIQNQYVYPTFPYYPTTTDKPYITYGTEITCNL